MRWTFFGRTSFREMMFSSNVKFPVMWPTLCRLLTGLTMTTSPSTAVTIMVKWQTWVTAVNNSYENRITVTKFIWRRKEKSVLTRFLLSSAWPFFLPLKCLSGFQQDQVGSRLKTDLLREFCQLTTLWSVSHLLHDVPLQFCDKSETSVAQGCWGH